MRVYIAGPYSGGDWGENVKRAVDAAEEVYQAGHDPFIPHTMTALWSMLYPKPDHEWLMFDLSWVDMCDALIRLEGESPGGDVEVKRAELKDIQTYMSVEEFLEEN